MLNAGMFAEFLKCIWNKVLPGHSIFWKDNLACFYEVICVEPLHLFHNWEFTVVNYNTKIMLDINCKDISSDRFQWPSWYFMWHYLVFGSCGLTIKTCGTAFDHLFYIFYISVHVDPIYYLMWEHQWCRYDYSLSWHGNPILDCYAISEWSMGCSSFCTSALVEDQPLSTSFAKALMYSSSRITFLISSVVMHSGMCVHDSIA